MPARIYHQDIYRFDRPVPSYWEDSHILDQSAYRPLVEDAVCDVAIIGGGFTGLNAAIRLTREFDLSVRVLEAGHIGWGASGRNGGFACQGAFKHSYGDIARSYSEEVARQTASWTEATVDHVDALVSDEGLDIDRQGEGNFQVAHTPKAAAMIPAELEELRHFGIAARSFNQDEFSEIGHGGNEQFGALQEVKGFGLHPLKYVDGLARTAVKYGANIHSRSEVVSWEKADGHHILRTSTAAVRAKKVLIACNGFMPEHLDKRMVGRVLPILSNIITTRPLTEEERMRHGFRTETPCYNMRNLLYYYRLLADGRFLLGARGDAVGSPEAGQVMKRAMIDGLHRVYPEWRDVEITHYWRGLVCFTRDFYPAIGQMEDDQSVFYSYAYHGNGVAAGSYGGHQIAGAIAGLEGAMDQVPLPFRRHAPKIPLPGLRRMYTRLAVGLYGLQDRHYE